MSPCWFRVFFWLSIVSIILLSVFLFDSVRSRHLFPGTAFNGVVMSRASEEKVSASLNQMHHIIQSRPVVFSIGEDSFEYTFDDVGIIFNTERTQQVLFTEGYELSFFERLGRWLGSWVGITHDIDIDEEIFTLDEDVFSVFIDEHNILPEDISLPFNGSLTLNDDGIVAEPPHAGHGIDMTQIQHQALILLREQPQGIWKISLDTTDLAPDVSLETFEHYRDTLTDFFSQEVRLFSQGEVVAQWDPDELRSMLEIIYDEGKWLARIPDTQYDAFFSSILARDATFIVKDNFSVTIEPSQLGLILDPNDLVQTFHNAFDQGQHTIEIDLQNSAEPTQTTEDLEALQISHVVAQFTTHYACCENRVVNIRRIAEIVDGAVIMPQASFDLNAFVGERTSKKGFVPAGAIFFGEHVDNVGGGVSQFATTLYNAAYWGGLWIDTHKPHSQYFPRYPEGIEATVSWKYPTLRFTNDYTTPVVIKTVATNTSLTVMILGNNNGRTVVGEQAQGSTNVSTPNTGDTQSRIVTSILSPRYNIQPSPLRYVAYPHRYNRGEERTTEIGKEGWSVDVTRTVTYPSPGTSFAQTWKVDYVHPTIIHVHSCEEVLDVAIPCFTGQ